MPARGGSQPGVEAISPAATLQAGSITIESGGGGTLSFSDSVLLTISTLGANGRRHRQGRFG